MKLLQIGLLILLPIYLLSQEANKFEIADSIIDVKEIMKEEFSDDKNRTNDLMHNSKALKAYPIHFFLSKILKQATFVLN